MRATATSADGRLKVRAIAGTEVVLIALDLAKADTKDLKGFALRRRIAGGRWRWLEGLKIFEESFPNGAPKPRSGRVPRFATNLFPIQSFLWSDYQADPEKTYDFEISAMSGAPGALEARSTVSLTIRTEAADDGKHGVWFNRGAIASQAFAEQFENKSLTTAEYNDPGHPEVAWLSRGLLEAFLLFVDETPQGDALRVVAYEFTYDVVLAALKSAMERGVDVQIVYEGVRTNDTAIDRVGLPREKNGEPILFTRTKAKIPHNKFIVRLADGGKPISVWTGSTNFTPSGFLGQTNVGHKVTDDGVAKAYFDLWTTLKDDPDDDGATAAAMRLSRNPANAIDAGVTLAFSPRPSTKMLDWYGARIANAATSSMFTGAFSVHDKILGPMAKPGPSMRFILLERPPTKKIKDAQQANPADLQFSYGAILGKAKLDVTKRDGHDLSGKIVKKIAPIPNFKIEEWFLEEELERKNNQGFVFFVHTKFLLVDALSDDPLICTGSANFSDDSLTANDENMLLIRGDTRVADIYLTEFDRIFRHFYSRDVINQIALSGGRPKVGILDPTDGWAKPYYSKGSPKRRKREMFFADTAKSWATSAQTDTNVFARERKPPT